MNSPRGGTLAQEKLEHGVWSHVMRQRWWSKYGSTETRSIFFVKSCANVCVMYVINPGSRIVGLTNDVLCENDTLVCSIRSIHPSRSIIASLPIENCDIVRNGKRTDINIEGENYHSSSWKLQLSSLIHISWNVKVLIFEQKIYIFRRMGIKKRKMMNRWRSVARCTIVQSCQRSLYYWFRTLIQHLSGGGGHNALGDSKCANRCLYV